LPGGVDDFSCIVLTFISDCLAKGILNRRVIAIDEVSVDKLDRKRGLPWFWSPLAVLSVSRQVLHLCLPTDRLPTMATFLCFDAGILANARSVGGRDWSALWLDLLPSFVRRRGVEDSWDVDCERLIGIWVGVSLCDEQRVNQIHDATHI
jgi:hypothetical protein